MNREERTCARVDARIIDEETRHEGTKVCNKDLAGERMRARERMHVRIRTQLLTFGNKNACDDVLSTVCSFWQIVGRLQEGRGRGCFYGKYERSFVAPFIGGLFDTIISGKLDEH